jgi:hypothetical protein
MVIGLNNSKIMTLMSGQRILGQRKIILDGQKYPKFAVMLRDAYGISKLPKSVSGDFMGFITDRLTEPASISAIAARDYRRGRNAHL